MPEIQDVIFFGQMISYQVSNMMCFRPILGKIECPTNVNQHFFVQLPDMTFVKQSAIHMFTFQSRDHKHEQLLEYVLAPVDPDGAVYLPACVAQNRPLRVKFCDGRV